MGLQELIGKLIGGNDKTNESKKLALKGLGQIQNAYLEMLYDNKKITERITKLVDMLKPALERKNEKEIEELLKRKENVDKEIQEILNFLNTIAMNERKVIVDIKKAVDNEVKYIYDGLKAKNNEIVSEKQNIVSTRNEIQKLLDNLSNTLGYIKAQMLPEHGTVRGLVHAQRNEMKIVLRILVTLPALLFIAMGLRWGVDPAGAAQGLGMTLLEGAGRSSQIGDVGGMFLSMGVMMLIALFTANRAWFLAPALLLSLIAVYRVVAFLVHDAALATDSIAVEVIVTAVLLAASFKLARQA